MAGDADKMVVLHQYDYLFAIGTIFAALDAWVSPIRLVSHPHILLSGGRRGGSIFRYHDTRLLTVSMRRTLVYPHRRPCDTMFTH